jgi:agmatinase
MNPIPFTPFGGPALQTPSITDADILVLPLCYEHSPSYGPGSKDGPHYVLQASEQLEAFDEELFVDWEQLRIHTLPPVFPTGGAEQSVAEMEQAAQKALDGNKNKFLLSLGGDHAVSIGPIRAVSNLYPDLGVLQVDAHLDLREEWNGSRYNHACVMRRVFEESCPAIIQVGIRSFSKEEALFVKQNQLSPYYMHDLEARGDDWIAEILEKLPENVYLTVDLDGLDPACVPGTGTPEPGGLSYRFLLELVRRVATHKRIVAADVNELVKIEGTQVSEYTAARIAQKIIVYTSFL